MPEGIRRLVTLIRLTHEERLELAEWLELCGDEEWMEYLELKGERMVESLGDDGDDELEI